MLNLRVVCSVALLLLLFGCSSLDTRYSPRSDPTEIKFLAEQYFSLYAERKQFDSFLDMYSDDIVLEDLVYGNRVVGKKALSKFFRWNSGDVELLEPVTLYVTSQVVDGYTVITRGHFTRFKFNGNEMGPWRFVIWLEFDEFGKISKQFDWINYTPKDAFLGGENLNSN